MVNTVPKPLTFGLQSNPGAWGHDGDNRLINAYTEDMGDEGKIRFPIRASPGLKAFGTPPNARGCRGMIPVGGRLYTVIGQALYAVDQTGTFGQSIGGVAGESLAFMAVNQRKPNPEIAIVSEGNRYLVDADPVNPTISIITDPDLPPPNSVIYLDSYFLYGGPDGFVYVSGSNDGASVDPLARFNAEGSPDNLVVLGVRSREAFLFGETTTEVWANDGSNNPAPFSRSVGEFIEHGCLAPNSVVKFMETLAFVDDEGIIRRIDGYTPTRISSHAVERAIEDLTDTERAGITGLAYVVAGHRFLQFSSAKWTWEFNGATGFWNERQSYQSPRFRGAVSAAFAGKQLIGAVDTGQILESDRHTKDEAGQPLIWTVRAPIQHSYPFKLKFAAFYCDPIPGVGLNETDPALKDPKIMLRYSDDGAKSWSNTRQLPIGKIGERPKRVRTNRLGRTGEDGRTWELSFSAAVCRGLTGAGVHVEQRRA